MIVMYCECACQPSTVNTEYDAWILADNQMQMIVSCDYCRFHIICFSIMALTSNVTSVDLHRIHRVHGNNYRYNYKQ